MEERSEVVSGLLPQLHLDELLGELQARLQAVVETRDRTHGLLEAVVAVGSGLDLETMLRRIVEAAVSLADARYGALGWLATAIGSPSSYQPAWMNARSPRSITGLRGRACSAC